MPSCPSWFSSELNGKDHIEHPWFPEGTRCVILRMPPEIWTGVVCKQDILRPKENNWPIAMDGPGPGSTFRPGIMKLLHDYRQPCIHIFEEILRGATHQLECLYTDQPDLQRPQGRILSLCDQIRFDIDSYTGAVTSSATSTPYIGSATVSTNTANEPHTDEATTPTMYMPPPLSMGD